METPSLRLLAILMVCCAVVTISAPAGKTLHEQRQALLQEKIELLRASLQRVRRLAEAGRVGQGELHEARIALFQSQLAAAAHAPDREKLQALLQQRVQQLQMSLERAEKLAAAGRLGLAELHKARLALITAQLAAATDASERAKLHAKLIAIHEQRCRSVEAEFRTGRATQVAVLDAKLTVLQAKIDKEQDMARMAETERAAKRPE